jgi:hypothetical protein
LPDDQLLPDDQERLVLLERRIAKLERTVNQIISLTVSLYSTDVVLWGPIKGSSEQNEKIAARLDETAAALNKLIDFMEGNRERNGQP